jgi:hypothetical protein
MTAMEFISHQLLERQALLKSIHEVILHEDKSVVDTVAPMMGKEMIIYNDRGSFKYGLASAKNYLSLHVLPIYGSEKLHTKYKTLLGKANFQKGCINFKNATEMPLDVVKELIADCSKIDLVAIREAYLKARK